MVQEDKELLLKDLSARLPYKPVVHAKWSYREINGELKHKEVNRRLEINDFYAIWDVKPYLRPMSSMTEEEKEEVKPLFSKFIDEFGKRVLVVRQNKMALYQDWLNAHHFDYRGLIEKGLAIEAPEGMYGKEEEK